MHYRLTLPILAALSFFVAAYQYFGRSIECVSIENFPPDFINSYCYMHSTYRKEDYFAEVVEERLNFPEVSKLYPDEPRIYQTYYKWIFIVLFLQAVACYFPRYFWTTMESGRMAELTELFQTHSNDINLLVNQTFTFSNRNYLFYQALAEVANAACALGHIFITDIFLGGDYCFYGLNVIRFAVLGGKNPMVRLFPKVVMCTYQPAGVPDSTETYDTTCLLPTNVLNEKIYLFLWFLFVLLSALSCLAVLYRVLFYLSSRIRMLNMKSSLVEKQVLNLVLEKRAAGDWFVINLLSMNVSPVVFRDFVLTVAEIGNVDETLSVE